MTSDPTNFRKERIEKLLYELRYEVERGTMSHEIDETLTFNFYVPISSSIPDGVVRCSFSTRPIHRHMMGLDYEPKLKLVKDLDK